MSKAPKLMVDAVGLPNKVNPSADVFNDGETGNECATPLTETVFGQDGDSSTGSFFP